MWKAALITLPLMGCVTTNDRDFDAAMLGYYTRADIDAITATMVCKQAARNLVQIARCEVKR
jgi:hypothetical protein